MDTKRLMKITLLSLKENVQKVLNFLQPFRKTDFSSKETDYLQGLEG